MTNEEKTRLFEKNEPEQKTQQADNITPIFDLGTFFKKNRLEQKKSLYQMQETSVVKVENFEKIENNDYGSFQDLFYLKMYIKEYAKQLDINYDDIAIHVDDLIERLDLVQKTKVFEVEKPSTSSKEKMIQTQKVQAVKINEDLKKRSMVNRKKKFELPSWIWIVLIILVLLSGYAFMKNAIYNSNPEAPNNNETTVNTDDVKEPTTTDATPSEIEIKQSSSGTNYEKWELITNDKITLTLTATKDNAQYEFCDDIYTNCGSTYPVTGTMAKDEEKVIEVTNATNFSLYLYDPSSFKIKVNGKEVNATQQNEHFVITKGTTETDETGN